MRIEELLSPVILLLLVCTVRCDSPGSADPPQLHDAREGDDVTLQCRFDPMPRLQNFTFYWVQTTENDIENVAIGEVTLQSTYRITYAPNEGRFDLLITNVSYDRDNGKFECRVRQGGTGRLYHAQAHQVVVLTAPAPPTLAPGANVLAQEERELKLTCSTAGGSPEPTIQWFREGSSSPLQAEVVHGRTREVPSVATLTFTPTKEDDGAVFRCVVSNRAMPPGSQFDASLDLSVNYFPRVEVGPDNPLRVEIDGTAVMECKVDAKPQVSSIRWTRNGKYISNSFTHTIHSVSIQDAGKYTCLADNGLGRAGEQEVYLDVLFPPTVTVPSKTYEAEEGGTVEIRCEVSSNPEPISIEWTMEGNQNFHQKGNTLVLRRVHADMVGTYVCRAANVISSSSGKSVEKASSASMALLVRHRPGRARISPERPVAQEGAPVTLSCSAEPPGWPVPQFRWYRDTGTPEPSPAVLSTSSQYSVPSAHLGSEGVYRCQATNELGHSDLASVTLEVHQPPHFQSKLPLHMTKRSGERGFTVSCSALGKPRPNIKWFKYNTEIKPDANLYEVKTNFVENSNSVYNVQSTLRFNGKARPNTNDLVPEDRGTYTCAFENEVKRVDSSMTLRIEHVPIAVEANKKVAYDLSETAEITCRAFSFPKPEFEWLFGSSKSAIETSPDKRYEIQTTSNNNDSYYSILRIKNISSREYGDYNCKVTNTLGSINQPIRLQPKGAPESPKSLMVHKVGPSYVTLKWEAGFNGGLTTKYFVLYRRAEPGAAGAGAPCGEPRAADLDWMEYDCGRMNPCNVTRLDQHSSYTFKVKALNTKGQSNFSNEIAVTTKVDKILAPEQVTYDPSSKILVFTAGPTCLSLVGVAEGLAAVGGWQVVDTVQLSLSGASSTVHEAQLEPPGPTRASGRRREPPAPLDDLNPRLRLKLCLLPNQDICSDYTEAEIGTYTKDGAALTTATLIAIVVSCLVFLLFLSLLFIFCRCKRNENVKETSKDYEMDSMRPPMSPQNQAPPPYYPSSGMENKALEHSMDLALEDSPHAVYATQGGYGYHAPHGQGHPGQNMPSSEWVNMGYIENSYTNSNNGGSVNSQDSLWQMKMAAANNAANMPAHQVLDRQSNYGYDPIAHGGYGTIDDYAPYPPLPHQPHPHPPHPHADYTLRSQNPSRQEYCSDPYASVHKPKKRMDQHIESPYHEVSGLPEAYGAEEAGGRGGGAGAGGEDKPHMSLSYDESLESGYSTPNSRARRVIREIIV